MLAYIPAPWILWDIYIMYTHMYVYIYVCIMHIYIYIYTYILLNEDVLGISPAILGDILWNSWDNSLWQQVCMESG